jgi:hypothetical protein
MTSLEAAVVAIAEQLFFGKLFSRRSPPMLQPRAYSLEADCAHTD